MIQKFYAIERELKRVNASPDLVRQRRQQVAKPITEELYTLLKTQEKQQLRAQSSESKALSYALNQWQSFIQYLENGKLEIDNNGVERAIRPTKLNLKNCLFFGSASAGQNNATLYTLIENSKAIGLNPRVYLETVLHDFNAYTPQQLTPKAVQNRLEQLATKAA